MSRVWHMFPRLDGRRAVSAQARRGDDICHRNLSQERQDLGPEDFGVGPSMRSVPRRTLAIALGVLDANLATPLRFPLRVA